MGEWSVLLCLDNSKKKKTEIKQKVSERRTFSAVLLRLSCQFNQFDFRIFKIKQNIDIYVHFRILKTLNVYNTLHFKYLFDLIFLFMQIW